MKTKIRNETQVDFRSANIFRRTVPQKKIVKTIAYFPSADDTCRRRINK